MRVVGLRWFHETSGLAIVHFGSRVGRLTSVVFLSALKSRPHGALLDSNHLDHTARQHSDVDSRRPTGDTHRTAPVPVQQASHTPSLTPLPLTSYGLKRNEKTQKKSLNLH